MSVRPHFHLMLAPRPMSLACTARRCSSFKTRQQLRHYSEWLATDFTKVLELHVDDEFWAMPATDRMATLAEVCGVAESWGELELEENVCREFFRHASLGDFGIFVLRDGTFFAW